MEELLAVLIGAGVLALSPLWVKGVRPVAKSAVKSGMAITSAAKEAAAATSQQWHEMVDRAGGKATTAEPDIHEQPAVRAAPTAEAPSAGSAGATAASQPAVDLRPMVIAAVKSGQTLAGAAMGAVAGVGKQWGDLIADANAELKSGGARSAPAETAAAAAPGATKAEKTPVETPAAATLVKTQKAEAPSPHAASATAMGSPVTPDDLQNIQGIGPKLVSILQEAGITTYAQLAATDEETLRDILTQAGPRYRLANPTSWPEEARQLMAAGSTG